MKSFLKKRWHSIPVGIVAALMALVLVASGAFAAYSFLGFATEINVDEPLTVEMAWWDYNEGVWTEWWEVTGEGEADELTLDISPAEVQTFGVRVYNISYGELTVHTVFSGETGYFTFDGFPNGVIPASNGNNSSCEWSTIEATITASGDTPPSIYTVNVAFTRE